MTIADIIKENDKKTEGKEKAEKFLYNLAIATLCGV